MESGLLSKRERLLLRKYDRERRNDSKECNKSCLSFSGGRQLSVQMKKASGRRINPRCLDTSNLIRLFSYDYVPVFLDRNPIFGAVVVEYQSPCMIDTLSSC